MAAPKGNKFHDPNNPGGRPTKYTDELLEKAYYYLENFKEFEDVIPSHIGLALHLRIRTSTVYDWAKQEGKKEFSDILDAIMKTQHQILISKGLSGDFNSNIAKLVLGKHGYHEKTDVAVKDETKRSPEHYKRQLLRAGAAGGNGANS